MKILITGFAGFVSRNFFNLLAKKNEDSVIIGIDRNDIRFDISEYSNVQCVTLKADLKDKFALLEILQTHKPELILHLASASSVSYSWKHPAEVFVNNNSIFISLLEAVKDYGKPIRVVSTGTSDVYQTSTDKNVQLTEATLVHPANPYAASKASLEIIAKTYIECFGLDIIQTRSFTHFGIYQKENFVLGKFAKELTLIKSGKQEPIIATGNLDLIRDLTDVRDVAEAYYLLLTKGKSGEMYNVCSGKGRSLRSVIEAMINKLSLKVEVVQDESLLRKGDIESIIGSNEKIKADTGWQPEISFEKSIDDLLQYWNEKVAMNN